MQVDQGSLEYRASAVTMRDMSPIETADRIHEARHEVALTRIRKYTILFIAFQTVAIVEFAASLVVLWRADLDVMVTSALIWSVSVPCAAGAAILSFCNWEELAFSERLKAVAPWGILVLELTIVLGIFAA